MDAAFTWPQIFAVVALILVCGWLLTTTLPQWRERRRTRRRSGR